MRAFNRFSSNSGLIHIKLVKYILYYISEIFYLSSTFDIKIDILNNIIRYIDSNFIRSKSN